MRNRIASEANGSMAHPDLQSLAAHVEELSVEDIEVFVLRGEFDAASSPELEQQLEAAINAGKCEVVVDMSDVSFIDVSTLNVVLRALKDSYRHNGHLVVVSAARPVLRAIELAGLRHALRVYGTREAALAAVHDGGE